MEQADRVGVNFKERNTATRLPWSKKETATRLPWSKKMEKFFMMRLQIRILIVTLTIIGTTATGHAFEPGLPPESAAAAAAAAYQHPGLTTLPSPGLDLPAPATVPAQPQAADYSKNLKSDVFGANLFTGAFASQGASLFNPDYVVAIGDMLQVRLWGAFSYDALLTVDPQGNVFLPNIGPMQVAGVRNQDLQRVAEKSVGKVFRSNVSSYVSIATAQPVRVFVGGYVNRPGLYSGTSMASLLYYLDLAGGIDTERGSFLNVQVKRGEEVRATVNLYDFLLAGRMPLIQLSAGDVIFVNSRQNTVKVGGLAENSKRFEFTDTARTVADLARLAKPFAQATHVRVVRNSGSVRNVEYYPLDAASRVAIQNGDEVDFTADKKAGTITVRVEGEHLSAQEYVLPNGARFGEVIKQVTLSERSDAVNVQLFRTSVRERQKAMFATALKSLESSVLTARSATSDEARLRKEEADLILKWIDRARAVTPSGQVVIATVAGRDELPLENGDVIRIPAKDGLVLINGEVLFPTTIVFNEKIEVEGYIERCGGFTQNANTSRVVVAHRDGSFDEGRGRSFFGSNVVRPGDEILVLPKIDVKAVQIVKELTQMLFQIAMTAKVVVGL